VASIAVCRTAVLTGADVADEEEMLSLTLTAGPVPLRAGPSWTSPPPPAAGRPGQTSPRLCRTVGDGVPRRDFRPALRHRGSPGRERPIPRPTTAAISPGRPPTA